VLRLRRATTTSEYRFKIGEFASTGAGDPKFQVEGVAPTNHFSQKSRLNDLSYGKKILTHHSFVLSQITRLTDGETDGRTDSIIAKLRLHCMHSAELGV